MLSIVAAHESQRRWLHRNPHGYDCHAHTGILLPEIE
jgi:hypothetical protein